MDGTGPVPRITQAGAASPDTRAAFPVGREAFVWELWQAHSDSMIRLAALLLGGTDAAEDVVQEAFIRVFDARERLDDPDRAVGYLRTTVVNLARSRWRRRLVARRYAPMPAPEPAGPEERALVELRRAEVIGALRRLPRREKEAVVLRYYADLSEAQAAETLGISIGSVKAYTSRGLAALGRMLEERS